MTAPKPAPDQRDQHEPPVIADERDHMQSAMHLMRDAFTEACQSGVPWQKAGELQAQFFDGYQAAKRAWGDALVKRDVLGKSQAALMTSQPIRPVSPPPSITTWP